MIPITIYTMAFNEEYILPFFLNHYKNKFSNCKIIIRDNCSTDNTAQIAKKNNCELIEYNTNGIHDDFSLQNLKNNCWKNASTDWVLICDPDEFLDINEEQLENEEKLGTTLIKPLGYEMINMEDNYNLQNITHGLRWPDYDKTCLINKKHITNINYNCGAHKSEPQGKVQYNAHSYNLYHYKWINLEYIINRFTTTASRISEINKKYKMGWENLEPEDKIKEQFLMRRQKIKNEGVKLL